MLNNNNTDNGWVEIGVYNNIEDFKMSMKIKEEERNIKRRELREEEERKEKIRFDNLTEKQKIKELINNEIKNDIEFLKDNVNSIKNKINNLKRIKKYKHLSYEEIKKEYEGIIYE